LNSFSKGSIPVSFVVTATVTTIDVRNKTYKFTPVRFTCAPIIAKNNGANMISNFSTYSST
jgi:hypothetical protein